MISQMRRRSRLIMFIVAASFVLGFGLLSLGGIAEFIRSFTSGESDRPRQANELGRVGKKMVITQSEYDDLKSYYKWMYMENTRARNVPASTEEEFGKQAWSQIVEEKKLADVMKKERIEVLGEEVIEILKMAPPQEIMGDSSFYTDGKFDSRKYEQVLYNQRFLARNYTPYRDFIRGMRLEADMRATVRVTSTQMMDDLARERTTFDLNFLALEPVNFVKSPPTDEVWAYFRSHRSEFTKPERRMMRLASFPLQITAEDSAAAKAQVDDIYASLQTDEDFLYQTDRNNDSIGDWLKIDTIDPVIQAELDKLNPGQFTAPILTTVGWQITRLEERTPDSLRLRFITVPVELAAGSYSAIRDKIDNLTERVKAGEAFDVVARELGGQIREMPPWEKGTSLQFDPEMAGNIEMFARKAKPGDISDVMRNPRNEIYVVQFMRLATGLATSIDSIETREKIAAKIMMQKARPKMESRAKEVLAIVKTGKPLIDIAKSDSTLRYQTRKANPIMSFMAFPGPEFCGALYALKKGEISDIVKTDRGLYIIQCADRQDYNLGPDPRYADARTNTDVGRIRNEIRKPINITDWRNPFNY